MTYTVRPMREADLKQVSEIDREAFPTQVPQPNYRQELHNKLAHYIVVVDTDVTVPPATPASSTGIRGLVARLKRRVAGEDDPEDPPAPGEYIVGFAGIWVLADESHVTNIAVRERYRRQGIGELMLIATIKMSEELRATTMTLEVRASNTTAQRLYSKYGFVEVGVRKGYYLDNREDGIIMTTASIVSTDYRKRLRGLREALAAKWGQPAESLGEAPSY